MCAVPRELSCICCMLTVEKYKGQGLNTDNQRKKILKDLEERLQKTEAKAEQVQAVRHRSAFLCLSSQAPSLHAV